jgi:hypothetical protein
MNGEKKILLTKKSTYGIISIVFVCVVAFFLFLSNLIQSNQTTRLNSSKAPQARAAIVDHLSLSYPNPAFVKECTAILNETGFTVDYYKGEEVTVELFRNLPQHSYDLIVLRVHSAYVHKRRFLDIFTSEPYSKKRYVYEQLRDRIRAAAYQPYRDGDPLYFGITSKFVQASMKGKFKDTLILMMGCNGLKYDMAQAFLEKGARVYIGWNGPVTAPYTDKATISLLKNLLTKRKTIEEAVTGTMKEIGWEPGYESLLLFLPSSTGNYAFFANGKIAKLAVRKDQVSRITPGVEPPEMSKRHPDMPLIGKVSDDVAIPEEIERRWKAIVIKVTYKDAGDTKKYTIDLKSKFAIPGSKLKIHVENFLPDLSMSPKGITSPSNETRNPAARVIIYDDEEAVFRGWLFKFYPEVHPFKHPRYSIILDDYIPAPL